MSNIRYGQKQIVFRVTPSNYNNDHHIEAIDQISGKVVISLISKDGFVPYGEYIPSINRCYIVYRSGGIVQNADGPSIINYKVIIFSLELPSDGESIQPILSQISKNYVPQIIIKEGVIGLIWNLGYIAVNTINRKTFLPNYMAGVFWLDDGEKIVSRNSINYIPKIYFPFSEIEIVRQTKGSNPIIQRVRFDIYGDFLWADIL